MAPILDIKQLYKNYGSVEILKDINVAIEPGDFLVLVGPSGCGKSTLLNCIAGLEPITGGTLSIGGKDMTHVSPKDRDIAMVFQSYALYPHMSVRENMAYGLKIRKISKEEIERRVQEAAEILEIGQYLDRKPRQLSGGQRQRVAMGRAIVRNPQVFLFDEPLSNLDAKLRVQMRLEIRKLQQRLGVTSIYVTHDQVEAMTLGDRLMVLNGGYVEQFGTPIELYDRPATVFVAGFIGSPAMNFLPVDAQGGTLVLGNGATLAGGAQASGKVTLGVRPEHLVQDDAGAIRIVVQMVEQLGANTLVHGVLEGSETDVVASVPGHVTSDAGTVMRFSAAAEDLHLFDATTGKRIDA